MATDVRGAFGTRAFLNGRFSFVVRTTTPEDRDLVEALFRDLPAPTTEAETAEFLLYRGGDAAPPPLWEISGPRLERAALSSLEGALGLLVSAVNIAVLDTEPEYLHLHAALATRDGRSVVIAADADTGKSTTVALLAARGWGYVSDETVRLPNQSSDPITGFTKPVSVKPGGRELIEHWQPWMLPPLGDGPEDFRFVPVGATGATIAQGGRQHLVVLLKRASWADDQQRGPVAVRLHPADAVVALMQQTLDAERFGAAALRLSHFAAASHSFEVTRGTPGETVDEVERLFELDPVCPMEVCVLPASPIFSSGVVSVMLGDRVVVHETASGRIFALDSGGTRVWRKLGGWSVDEQLDLQGPVIEPFVAELRRLGVFADAP